MPQAVVAIVQEAMTYLDSSPDEETRVELIKTLNNVAAGKVLTSSVHATQDGHGDVVIGCMGVNPCTRLMTADV